MTLPIIQKPLEETTWREVAEFLFVTLPRDDTPVVQQAVEAYRAKAEHDEKLDSLPALSRRLLSGNVDALKWAEEFVKLVKENPSIATDEGAMLGWFASAMAEGEIAVEKRERNRPLVERLRELLFLTAGAATRPLLEDNPHYVFPSERVAAAVEDICKEQGLEETAGA